MRLRSILVILVDFEHFGGFGENFDGQKVGKHRFCRIDDSFMANWYAVRFLEGVKVDIWA